MNKAGAWLGEHTHIQKIIDQCITPPFQWNDYNHKKTCNASITVTMTQISIYSQTYSS